VSETSPLKIYDDIKLECASLIVCWTQDAGRIGIGIADYLISKLNCRVFGEIEPTGFFPLGGVTVEDNVAQFPQSKLYHCPQKGLLIFRSDTPRADWYRFLNAILDLAGYRCRLSEMYTIGSMIYLSPHTAPRQITGVANSTSMKQILQRYAIDASSDFETPDTQRPTINSYLLWVAKQRNISGASLWSSIPFYLTGTTDPQAWRKTLGFLNQRFELDFDFTDLDKEVADVNEKLAKARQDYPELNDYLNRLEANQELTIEENEKLVEDIEEFLKKKE
jgi:predicted ATP-grasp superfamily ATP-dependent carboligase